MTLTNDQLHALIQVIKLPEFEPSGDEVQNGYIEIEKIKSPFYHFDNVFFFCADYSVVEYNDYTTVYVDQIGLFVGDMDEIELTPYQESILSDFVQTNIEDKLERLDEKFRSRI